MTSSIAQMTNKYLLLKWVPSEWSIRFTRYAIVPIPFVHDPNVWKKVGEYTDIEELIKLAHALNIFELGKTPLVSIFLLIKEGPELDGLKALEARVMGWTVKKGRVK